MTREAQTAHSTRPPGTIVRIGDRFCGPPEIGNGGVVCALLAGSRTSAHRITLRRPAPLERTLHLSTSEDGTRHLLDGEEIVAEARATSLELDVPAPPDWDACAVASRAAEGRPHPFPRCFVCGPDRSVPDGMRLLVGPVHQRPGLVAAAWTPPRSYAGEHGHVMDRFLWAALDCPGAMAIMRDEPREILLGQLTGEIHRPVVAGEPHRVIAWPIASEGRKHTAGSAIFDAEGRVCARSQSLWFDRPQAAVA